LARRPNLHAPDSVIVFGVDEDRVASEAGLQRGDVIREVNRQRARSLQDFEKVTKDVTDGDHVTVRRRGPQSLLRQRSGGDDHAPRSDWAGDDRGLRVVAGPSPARLIQRVKKNRPRGIAPGPVVT